MMEEMLDAAPGAVGHHMAHHVFGQNDRRQHVQTDQRLDLGIAHIGQQPFGADSGVVDEAVDRAEGVAQFLHEGGNLVGLAEIERPEVQAIRSRLADGGVPDPRSRGARPRSRCSRRRRRACAQSQARCRGCRR
jgi:hypothetical protein